MVAYVTAVGDGCSLLSADGGGCDPEREKMISNTVLAAAITAGDSKENRRAGGRHHRNDLRDVGIERYTARNCIPACRGSNRNAFLARNALKETCPNLRRTIWPSRQDARGA